MIPKDCKVSIEEVCFDSLIRPMFYLGVSVESKDLGICMTRYIVGHPVFLRLRLWIAVKMCLSMLRKYRAFNNSAL